jgi:hypothetical protein
MLPTGSECVWAAAERAVVPRRGSFQQRCDIMTKDPDRTSPVRVEVTTRFIAETTAKQRAYAARRRMWTAAFYPSEPRAQALSVSRHRGRIHDPRQGKFDL